jgi:antitoxin component YwqK of YwqJK toxin-antitoxin module
MGAFKIMLDSEQFQNNIKRWSLFHPAQAALLPNLKCQRIEYHKNINGDLNLKTTEKGSIQFFHSEEDPREEAKQQFNELNLKDIKVIYVFGLGLGYFYEAAKEWLHSHPERFLVFLESDLEVIHLFLQTERSINVLFDQQVWLTFADEEGREIDSIATNFLLQRYHFIALGLYAKIRRPESWSLKAKLEFYSNLRAGSLSEFSDHGRRFYFNYFRNIFEFPRAFLGNAFFGKFKNIPAIICGAGPSLAKNLPLLKNLKENALIFAGGTAMNALNTEGILPHFGVGIDPNQAQFTRLIMNQAYEIPYFYRNRMNHNALKTIHGPHLYITGSSGYQISRFFEEKLGIDRETFLSEGFNVINFSLSIAHAMGCNPIIFIGLDLAYTDSLSYCPGIINHPLHDRREYFGTKTNEEELINKADFQGNPTLTLWKWISESAWFANFAKTTPRTSFYNATEGGLGFAGVANVAFADLIKNKLNKQFDLSGKIHQEIQHSQLPQRVTDSKLVEWSKELLESLKASREIFKEIIREYGENIKNCHQEISETALHHIEKLRQEIAYKYLLCDFNESYDLIFKRKFQRLKYDKELLTEIDYILQFLVLEYGRYKFLLETATANIDILESILKEDGEVFVKTLMPSKQTENTPFHVQAPQECYSFSNQTFTMIDPEFNLNHCENFTPEKRLEVYREYFPDSTLKLEQYFLDGILHGPSTYYSNQGNILSQNWFFKGLQQGKAWRYYPDGTLASKQGFHDGQWEGTQEYFYSGGSIKSFLTYSKGLLNGVVRLFYPDGKLKREVNFINGKRQGYDRLWDEIGLMVMEAQFEMDTPVGAARQWFSNGNISKEVVYDKETKEFKAREWNENGSMRVLFKGFQGDYFDRVSLQTQKLNKTLETLVYQLQAVIPAINQLSPANKTIETDEERFSKDLNSIKNELKHLDEISNKLLYETGLDTKNQRESIWKTPARKKEVEDQIQNLSGSMNKEMNQLQKTLFATLGKLSKRLEENKNLKPSSENEKNAKEENER